MRISRNRVYDELHSYQTEYGGYYGEDLKRIAKQLGVNNRTLRRYMEQWKLTDPRFQALNYLGQRSIPLTLDDYDWLEQRINHNPTEVRNRLFNEINEKHSLEGRPFIGQRTFYNVVENISSRLKIVEKELGWLVRKGIVVGPKYSLDDSRKSLQSIFTYSNLKFHSGISLAAFSERLKLAENWFISTYEGIDPLSWYPIISDRSKLLRNQLSTIPIDELQDVQGRLAFETQVCFLIEGYDRLIDEIMLRRGRVQQSRNAARAALERDLLRQWSEIAIPAMNAVIKGKDKLRELETIAIQGEELSREARKEALTKHIKTVNKLWNLLSEWTDNFSEDRLKYYGPAASLIIDLAREPAKWNTLSYKEKRRISRDNALTSALDGSDLQLRQSVILDRYLKFLKSGKIIDRRSWQYGDLGDRLRLFSHGFEKRVSENDIMALMSGKYQFPKISDVDLREEVPDAIPFSTKEVHLSHLLDCVSKLVIQSNNNWFDSHRETFHRQSDGMLRMNYTEDEYRARLYQSIGFLGRNLRYSDSPDFRGLEYFIHRYLSDQILDLEMKHLWQIVKRLSGHSVNLILVDTMGINSRRKSFFAKLHGRYRTIGFSDLRAVASSLVPVYSTNCRSTDSEAMNIIPILAHAKKVLGPDLQWYTGNGHTVSRLAAGMAFAAHKVIAAGRIHGEPKLPGPRCLKRLLHQCSLINQVGHALQSDPELGRLLASRHHYYVNGINVRRLLEDLGSVVLWAQREQGIKLDHLAQLIETSNRQKRVIRIVERGVTRVHEPNVSLVLKCAELLLCCIAVWRLNEGIRRLEVVENPVSLEGVVMFTPA